MAVDWVEFDEETAIRRDLILGVKLITKDKDNRELKNPETFIHVNAPQGWFLVKCSYQEALQKLRGH